MRRFIVAPLIAALLALAAFVAPVGAITGGQPDGEGHPQAALLLFPGWTFCSGSLIGDRTILTAGHCTSGWTELAADPDVEFDGAIIVSFDSQASVDEDWLPDGGTWYTASSWVTHPGYIEADWPYTYDYGLLYLDTDQVLADIEPATLAEPGTLDPVINDNGQSPDLFDDVGYGIQGKTIGGGPPLADITWQRKIAVQTEAPGNGSHAGLDHETWFITKNNPSAKKGGACGGDSGSVDVPARHDRDRGRPYRRLSDRLRGPALRSAHVAEPPHGPSGRVRLDHVEHRVTDSDPQDLDAPTSPAGASSFPPWRQPLSMDRVTSWTGILPFRSAAPTYISITGSLISASTASMRSRRVPPR